MNCPTCTTTALLMTDRQGVEIDYCPQCRGVWLDRGELDKLMELSANQAAAQAPSAVPARNPSRAGSNYQPDFQDSDYRGVGGQPIRRKKSWLNDIFD
jgi:uncharacterized protein